MNVEKSATFESGEFILSQLRHGYWRLISTLPILRLTSIMESSWLLSHAITLLGTIMYFISALNGGESYWATVPWYNYIILSAMSTYSIVVYSRPSEYDEDSTASEQNNTPLYDLLKSEDTYLLIYAFLWACTPHNILKVLSFSIYSLLNLTDYLIFDAFFDYPFSKAFAPFVNYIEDPLMILSAHIDLAVIGLLFVESFQTHTFYPLVLYTFTWILRIQFSQTSRLAITNLLALLNYIILQPDIPDRIRNGWIRCRSKVVKMFLLNPKHERCSLSSSDTGLSKLNIAS